MQQIKIGTAADDRLIATTYVDQLGTTWLANLGLAAGDTVVLRGGTGNDTLIGTTGDDRFDGGAGADLMIGGGGNDSFFTTIPGIPGGPRDTIEGFGGQSQVIFQASAAQLSAATTQAELTRLASFLKTLPSKPTERFVSDILGVDIAGVTAVKFNVGGTLKSINELLPPGSVKVPTYGFQVDSSASTLGVQLAGGTADDTLTGGSGNDYIDGYAGADLIDAGAGADTISTAYFAPAGGPRDTIDGGAGNDLLLIVIQKAQWNADPAVRAEVARIVELMKQPGFTLQSDVFHLDMINVERVQFRLDGVITDLPTMLGITARDDAYAGTEDTLLSVLAAQGLLANDTGGVERAVVAGTYQTSRGGTVTIATDGSFNYKPADNVDGVDSFTYTVKDSIGNLATATARITLASVADPATISGTSAGSVAEDGTLTASGQLAVTDPDAGEAGFRMPASLAGTYGSFSFDATTGTWGYALDNAATNVQALKAGQTVTDTLRVTSLDGTATRGIVVTIGGADDAAAIGGTATGTVAEDGILIASGQLTLTDPDAGEAGFRTPASLAGTYGSFSFNTGTGAWGYTLNNAAANVQSLKTGQTVTETLRVTSLDGTATRDIVVTIAGADDIAAIGGTATGAVAEDGALTASGQLTVTDQDAGEAGFRTPASLAGAYGSFSFNPATGTWGYALNNAAGNVQALKTGQTVTETLRVTSLDGTATRDIVVTIAGADDAASIGGTVAGAVAEDGSLTASGQLTVTDPDAGEAGFRTPTSLAGTYGGFSFDAATGAWSYTLNNAAANVQTLKAGQTVTDTLTVTSLDGTATRNIVVTIVGTNDAAVMSGSFTTTAREDALSIPAPREVLVSDPDAGEAGIQMPASLNGTYGAFTLEPGLIGPGIGGTFWNYLLDNTRSNVQALRAGEVVTDRLTVTSIDGSVSRELVVTITGTGDAAVIGGTATGAVQEDGTLTASGQLTITDVDRDEAAFQVPASLAGTYGSFTFNAATGAWGYTLSNAAAHVQALNAGQTVTDTLRVSSLDGSATRDIVVSIAGAADGPPRIPSLDLRDVAATGSTLGFKILGEARADRAGFSVAGGSDINGDGYDDVVIGAPYQNGSGREAGAAYVVYGGASPARVKLADIAASSSTLGFKIAGVRDFDHAGMDVSLRGDINGDGLPDIVVGDFTFYSEIGAGAFAVYGKSGGATVRLADIRGTAGSPGFKVVTSGDLEGVTTSTIDNAGDVNGDGLDDLIIGTGAANGDTYVVFGKRDSGTVNLDDIFAGTSTQGFRIAKSWEGNPLGRAITVSSAGDVNGDGKADIVIGVRFQSTDGISEHGAAYVVYGKSDTSTVNLSQLDAGTSTAGVKILGTTVASQAGYSVAPAGDVNGDGLADILIGAPAYFDAGGYGYFSRGSAYVVFGQPSLGTIRLDDILAGGSAKGFAILGEQFVGGVGWSVASAGDLNGDGKADILLGSPDSSSQAKGRVGNGEVFVVWGKASGTTVDIDLVKQGKSTDAFLILGETSSSKAGMSVAAAGDVNGDGLADLIIGASNADNTTPDMGLGYTGPGAAYVVYGQAGWLF